MAFGERSPRCSTLAFLPHQMMMASTPLCAPWCGAWSPGSGCWNGRPRQRPRHRSGASSPVDRYLRLTPILAIIALVLARVSRSALMAAAPILGAVGL